VRAGAFAGKTSSSLESAPRKSIGVKYIFSVRQVRASDEDTSSFSPLPAVSVVVTISATNHPLPFGKSALEVPKTYLSRETAAENSNKSRRSLCHRSEMARFVSGHDFSRAAGSRQKLGL
jgi:hypothetical protein